MPFNYAKGYAFLELGTTKEILLGGIDHVRYLHEN